jgi:muramoyltetrapeptide carboxypeptidase
MTQKPFRIGIVATGVRIEPETAAALAGLAASLYSPDRLELFVHPQCFLSHGHFAGADDARAGAFLEIANDPRFDALWFARGGYGACRIAGDVLARLGPAAREKVYLGYSDAGMLLAGLYKAGCRVAHGPMPVDLIRAGGDAAVARALAWLVDRNPAALEGGLRDGAPNAAFNLTILSHLLGTPLEPDLSGHVLLLEDVAEHMYRIDRSFFHVTAHPALARLAGIRLGRFADVPANAPDFVLNEVEVAQHWCARAGIPYLGRADIGHDVDNKIVPFG